MRCAKCNSKMKTHYLMVKNNKVEYYFCTNHKCNNIMPKRNSDKGG